MPQFMIDSASDLTSQKKKKKKSKKINVFLISFPSSDCPLPQCPSWSPLPSTHSHVTAPLFRHAPTTRITAAIRPRWMFAPSAARRLTTARLRGSSCFQVRPTCFHPSNLDLDCNTRAKNCVSSTILSLLFKKKKKKKKKNYRIQRYSFGKHKLICSQKTLSR